MGCVCSTCYRCRLVIPVGEEQVVKDVEATLKEGIHRTEEVVVRKV